MLPGDNTGRVMDIEDSGSRGRFVDEEAARRVSGFGGLVRERREAAGMTVKRLAEIAGTSRNFVHDLEAGKDTAQLGRALLVAEAVGLDLITALREHLSGRTSPVPAGFDDDALPEPDEPEDEAPGFGR
jgi:HTH-type transcriptional regulator/antitoxin HipB